MGKILYIDNKLCSNIEQLRSYFNAPINYGSNIFMDILDYGRSGDLSLWLREHEENELALNIDDIDQNIGDGEYISRITDIINNHLFSHNTSSSLKPEPLQCFTIESIKVEEDNSELNTTISLKILQSVNEWYNIVLKTLSGAASTPRRLNPYDYKVGKVINIKFDFPLPAFDKSEIRVFVDGVELKKNAKNKTYDVNKSQIVVCSRSGSFIQIGLLLDNECKREKRIRLRKGENIISVEDYPELRYGISFSTRDGNPEYIESIILDEFDTSNVINMNYMFSHCSSLETLDLSNFDTSKVTDMNYMFYGCSSLKALDLSSFDTYKITNMISMFYGCSSLEALDLSNFDTSNVTNMINMFFGCSSLKTLDLSGFDTSNVTNMISMFYGCSSLKTLDLSGFDTSNVTNMISMFYCCSSLKTLDLSGFDTSNVTNMDSMFDGCSSLETLHLSSFDTSNVTNMGFMFHGCSSLETLDLSNFDTSNVTNMISMFYCCSSLKTLDLSCFDTSNVTDMGWMFHDCNSLKKVIMKNCNEETINKISEALAKAGINANIITD